MKASNESALVLEGEIQGSPKDIVIPNRNAVIECRSFDVITTLQKLFDPEKVVDPEQLEVSSAKMFTKRFRLLGWFGLSEAFGVDEEQRFWEKALEEKHRQLVTGMCNIIAFYPDPFASSSKSLRPALEAALEDARWKSISGLFVVAHSQKSRETTASRDLWFDVDFVVNENADISPPEDFVAKFANRGSGFVPGRLAGK